MTSAPAYTDPFDVSGRSMRPAVEALPPAVLAHWQAELSREGQVRKAAATQHKSLTPADLEALARQVFDEVSEQARAAGVDLGAEALIRLIGELSGLGPLLGLISQPDIEDIALNLGHLYAYGTVTGWTHRGPAPAGLGDALRILIDRAGQRIPTPDYPITDAMLQVLVPLPDGSVRRKGIRLNYLMQPASPYGDVITLRVSNYRTAAELGSGSLAALCASRLPPVERPVFAPLSLPRGNGVLTPEAANYLLAVMVRGGTLILAGSTGSGKTFIAQRIIQEMLAYFQPGAIRLFVIEDSNEIVLNGWDGDPAQDTGNIVYTVTRPEIRGGPPPVETYDLIRAALRARPHGLIIGEARGKEAWELVRAAATGHGHSAFTMHATSAEMVWPRFLQMTQAHPEAARMGEYQVAQAFAEAVTAVVHVERHAQYGQVVRDVVEVSPVVERGAGKPAFLSLFRYDPAQGRLLPTGNRPTRLGFHAADLHLPDAYFTRP